MMTASLLTGFRLVLLETFDAERFFEAHEILEAYWIDYGGHDRGFFRGLIQAAVALHHFRAGTLVGAQGVAARSRRNLAPYAPTHLGFDVDSFVAPVSADTTNVAGAQSTAPAGIRNRNVRFNPQGASTYLMQRRHSPSAAHLPWGSLNFSSR